MALPWMLFCVPLNCPVLIFTKAGNLFILLITNKIFPVAQITLLCMTSSVHMRLISWLQPHACLFSRGCVCDISAKYNHHLHECYRRQQNIFFSWKVVSGPCSRFCPCRWLVLPLVLMIPNLSSTSFEGSCWTLDLSAQLNNKCGQKTFNTANQHLILMTAL